MQVIDVSESPESMDEVRGLFREYAAEVGIDFNFQNFEQELRELPGRYMAPAGCILLALVDGELAGCVALRPLEDYDAELKRMYVRPAHRKKGIAAVLATRALNVAFETGYRRVRLDTLKSMKAARALYESFGFTEIEPYYDNPIPDVVYYELDFLGKARKVVGANLDQVGSGPWAVVVYNDDETDMEFVHLILNQIAGLDAQVASAVMHMTHLHGSAIARRFEDKDAAEALHAAMQGFILRESAVLKTGIIRV